MIFYLREEGGHYVGPFKCRKDAERFIRLMELCGENWAGAEVVEEEGGIARSLSENQEGARSGRRGDRCEAARRSRCRYIGEERQRSRCPRATRKP